MKGIGKKVFVFLVLLILLTNAFSVVYVAKPILAGSVSVETEDLDRKNVGPTLSSRMLEPSVEPEKSQGSFGELSGDRPEILNRIGANQSGDFIRLDDNKTRLVVGIDGEKGANIFELEKMAARHQAKIVGSVSMGGKVRAIVFELLLASVEGFVGEVHAAKLASYVEPSMKVQVQFVPNDPYWSMQWGPKKVEADWAWNTTLGDSSILVAVVDTGIYYPHSDLAANYVALGRDWANNDTDPMDDYGHGTHCAGIIAAVLNNSEGIAGLAQVRVMAEKVLDAGGWGYDDWVANGIVHATDCGAKIISMSIGGWGDSELIHEAVKYAYDAGVLLIAAAGNSNSNMKSYPAGYDEVVAVAATDQDDNKASFSNWGDWIELSAPGVSIYSTVPWGYECWSGTSMACPHVAGVAALAWSHYPNRTRDWVRIWLRSSADDLGDSGYDSYYGHGRVNARKTVEMSPPSHELIAYTWETPPYVELGTPATINATILNFGENETGLTVELLANGTVVNSGTIDILPGGNSATVNLAWSPTVEGSYNITFYVVPVVGEVSLENNALWKYMYVGFPVKAVVLHSLGNVNGDIITNWQTLTNEWYLFGDTMTYIDYTSLNKKDITYDDIRATEADVLIISCAYDPNLGWQFTDSEIEAIQRYVHEGHGLIATCATLYYGVPNNNKLAPLFGLNKTTVWRADQGTDLLHVLNTTHPVFDDVPNPLVFPEVATTLPNDGRWDSNELVGDTYLAIGHYQESAITVFRGLVYVSPLLEIIPPYYHHHLQLLYNAIRWSQYEKPEHELTVSLEAPTHLNPGESALLNATVSNIGLSNETDVSIYLLVNDTVVDTTTISLLVNDTSQTIEYMWSPSIEGRYNITAYAPPVPNESILADNVVAEMVRVRLGGGLVVFEEAHLPPYTIGSNPAAEVVGGYSEFANYIIANGYTVSTINPGTTITPDVLAPVDVLVIVAPSNSYYDSELNAIEDWVRNGGNLLLISDNGYYGYQARTIATRFGINMQGDMICDSDENVGYPYWPFYDGSNIIPHMATDGVSRVEMYAGDGIILVPTGEMPLIRTDSDGTAYWYNSGRSAPGISVASAFEGGTTGSGRLVVVTDTNVWDSAYDADGDGTPDFYDSYNEIFALDCIDWLSIRYPHDLSVGLDAPNVAKLGDLTKLNATVVNRGLNNETDVELRLLINGSTVDSVVLPELFTLQHCTLGYAWTPEIEGAYNITAYVLPVSGEDYVADNVAAKDVSVRQLKNVLFDQTHQTDYIGNYYLWTTSLLQRGYLVDTLTASPVTSDLLDACDVFVIPQAMVSYTLDELLAIQNFVMNGGGLLVIGDDYPYIYTDLTGFAGITWAYGGTWGTTTDIIPHPVTQGVVAVYLAGPGSMMNVAFPAVDLIRDQVGNVMLAVSEIGSGRVLGMADEDSIMDWSIGSADNLRLANNMVDWLAPQVGGSRDVAVVNAVVSPSEVYPGWIVHANVTVANLGNVAETFTVSLYYNSSSAMTQFVYNLQPNATLDLSLSWDTTSVALGNYTISAVASTVATETNTVNNMFVGGTVEVRLIGDIKKDRVVDVFDCILASMAFGATPSDPQWNLFCDMKQDNVIDIFDMVLIAEHFGQYL